MSKSLIGFLLCVATCSGVTLPSYITKCKFNDAAMAACMKDNMPNIKPHLKDGIPELAVPPLSPFHLDELVIDATQNLKIKMIQLDILGLDTFDMKEITTEPADFFGKFDIFFETLQIIGTYDIDGQILVLPIKGHGPANITLHDFTVNFQYNYRPEERDGKQYVKLSNQNFEFRAGKITLKLENLFNGDQALGDQVNAFLNENWKEVEEILRPAVTDTVMNIVGGIFNTITGTVALEDMFIV